MQTCSLKGIVMGEYLGDFYVRVYDTYDQDIFMHKIFNKGKMNQDIDYTIICIKSNISKYYKIHTG